VCSTAYWLLCAAIWVISLQQPLEIATGPEGVWNRVRHSVLRLMLHLYESLYHIKLCAEAVSVPGQEQLERGMVW
jgi:hypothetical protein